MQWQIIISILIFALSSMTFADQSNIRLLSKKDLPHQLGTFREIEFNLSDDQTITFDSALLNYRYQAELYQNENKIQLLADYLDELSQKNNFIIGINGGYYQANFTPAGLFMYQGKLIKPISHSPFFNACLIINDKNNVLIGTNLEACKNAHNALQAGPLLIEDYKKSSRLPLLQKKSKSMADFFDQHKRTVLAVTNDDRLLIIITSPIALIDLADFLEKHADAFGVKKIKIAMNLDGGSSTGMYIRFADEPFYSHELKHVKTFLFVK